MARADPRRPRQAAATAALRRRYKPPVWFSANIHGNEWEGTDASLQVIEELVDAPRTRGRATCCATTASTSR